MSNRAGGWLTVEEAGGELKVSAQAVEELVARGELAAATVGNEVRIPVSSLERYASRAERAALGRRFRGARPLIGLSAAALVLASAVVIAARPQNDGAVVPVQIPYRGTLEHNGVPVTDTGALMEFSLFTGDEQTDPTADWTEEQAVSVQDGTFSVALGSVTPIPTDLFAQSSLYLSIKVDGQQLAGRQRLLTVPYAQQALSAAHARRAEEVDSVPPGAVMFFNMATCPAGWQLLDAARGRALVGLHPGGTLGGVVGDRPLNNLENRAHAHGMDHYHHYESWTGETNLTATRGRVVGGYNNTGYFVTDTTVDEVYGQNHNHFVSNNTWGASITATGASWTSEVMPYLQLLVCQKL